MKARSIVRVASPLALAAAAVAQPGYTWSTLPGLFPAGSGTPRVGELTFADVDGGGPLPTQLVAVGALGNASGTGGQTALRWTGTSWVPLTPQPPYAPSLSYLLKATNFGGRLRLHGVAFTGGPIASYANSWAITATGDVVYPNPAAVLPSGIVYSNTTGPLKVFDGANVVQTIPAPNWFSFAFGAGSRTMGTKSIFGQLYAFGGVTQDFAISQPIVVFYTGVGSNPWISLTGGSVGGNIGEPTALESSQGDVYLATAAYGGSGGPGSLYVRRNATPNQWTFLGQFYLNSNSFNDSGIYALSTVVVGGTTWLVIGGAFDTVLPSGPGPAITNVGGAILYDGANFVRMGTGFGGVVTSITTTDFRTLYLGGHTNDASLNPIVRTWNPPAPCYGNCDGSTAAPVLNALDFQCFLTRYRAGESYANCDGSTAAPVLNALDFQCFLDRYRQGC